MKISFKGSSKIENPVDVENTPIKEGCILTHCWFDGNDHSWLKMSEEEKVIQMHKPLYIVKKHQNGGLFAESIDEKNYLYMHDFRFKYTKVIK